MWWSETFNADETRRLGRAIARFLQAGDVVGLTGELGAGKTTFVQGVAEGIGVPKGVYVNSPTFTIVREYPTVPKLYHFDFYRLRDPDELVETGYEDAIRADGVCFVEWFELLPEAAPASYLQIEITQKDDRRLFRFAPRGVEWQGRLDACPLLQRGAPP